MRHGLMTSAMAGTFDHAALVAADVPEAMILPPEPLSDIVSLASDVTVVINDDGTLSGPSKVANGGSRRLGHYGPPLLDLLPRRITVVDYVTGLQGIESKPQLLQGGTTWDTVTHQYYRNDRNARADLAAALAGRPTPLRIMLPPEEQVLPFSKRRRHAMLRFTGP
jgi:hypothetical protein